MEPYSLAVINASLTHFPHLSSGGLDDSVVSIDTTVDEKELGVSWDVVRTLQKFFYPGIYKNNKGNNVYCMNSKSLHALFQCIYIY